mmetsp:Transcript_107582/g.302903  ORF Transcript_107582/g.302903 Transcript_107582/m.302903 type:complete len:363 (-) Transcript_107582:95-1183(-)
MLLVGSGSRGVAAAVARVVSPRSAAAAWRLRHCVLVVQPRMQASTVGLSAAMGERDSSSGHPHASDCVAATGGLVLGARAQPLSIPQELVLYEAFADMSEIVARARFRCQLGAALATAGFAALLSSISATLSPVALVSLLSCAAANSYALAVVSQRVIRNVAMRHVERLAVLPTPQVAEARSPADEEPQAAVASLLSGAATVEERLSATAELRLALRTASAERWLVLADPEDSDGLASFGDICSRARLIHIDVGHGKCTDQALLDALVTTRKVVAEERVEALRDDIPAGPMLSEVTIAALAQVEGAAESAREPPADAVERLGKRARTGGVSVFFAGMLFTVGEGARDPDGAARWTNLIPAWF